MASSPLAIHLLAICMTFFVSTRHISSASAASFVRQFGNSPIKRLSTEVHRRCSPPSAFLVSPSNKISGARSRRESSHYFSTSSSSSDPTRKMSTSLKASQEGLSDIGKSSNNNNIESGDCKIPNWKERIDISIAKSRKVRGSNYVQISTINYKTMEPRCRTVVFRGFLKGVPSSAVQEVLGGDVVKEDDEEDAGDGAKFDCVMKMITDLRSNKVQELKMLHNELKKGGKNGNTVEMVWWFAKSSEQYRVGGRLQFIGSNGPLYSYTGANSSNEQNINYFLAERKQQWGNLSDMAREQFYWENPGVPFSSTWDQAKGVPPGGRDDDGKVLPPPDTFLLMLLYPKKIDYLRLSDNFRQVDAWDWGNADGVVSDGRRWKSMRVNP